MYKSSFSVAKVDNTCDKKRINKLKIRNMPIPTPTNAEGKDEYIVRCMSDETMITEFGDTSQRYAVCINTYEENK